MEFHLQARKIRVVLALFEASDGVLDESHYQIRSSIDTYELHYQGRFRRQDIYELSLSRARLAVLVNAQEASGKLYIAVNKCLEMAPPLRYTTVKHLLRRAKLFKRQDVIDKITADRTER